MAEEPMNDDAQLLEAYLRDRSEAAFGDLVRRHLNLVYATALRRCEGREDLAGDIAQTVFIDLARKAPGLSKSVVLSGWLHRHTCFTASKTMRAERRRLLRDHAAWEQSQTEAPAPPPWEQLAPCLDVFLDQLPSADRDALVLRFLERRPLQEVGRMLGVSDDAAQKRVHRALERLRGLFARAGWILSAAALAESLSAAPVIAVPTTLAASIAPAAMAVAGSVGSWSWLGLMASTKLKTTAVALAVGAGLLTPIFIHEQTRSLHALRAEELAQERRRGLGLQAEVDRLMALRNASRPLDNGQASEVARRELARLRGEVSGLKQQLKTLSPASGKGQEPADSSDPVARLAQESVERTAQLRQWLAQNPQASIPELALLEVDHWGDFIYPLKLETTEEMRRAMSNVRANAELKAMDLIVAAWRRYLVENPGDPPTSMSALAPYLRVPLEPAVLERYQWVRGNTLPGTLAVDEPWVLTQKAPVDPEWDDRFSHGLKTGGSADSREANRWKSKTP